MITVSIWGSCVSRDTLALSPTFNDELTVGKYVARQSWISAVSDPVPYPGDTLTSKFQSRMLRGDFASNALEMIRESSSTSDFIVLDLVDDRFNTVQISESQYFTLSATAKKQKMASYFPIKNTFKPGTPEHTQLWLSAAKTVRKTLDAVMGKVLVLGVPWATGDSEGESLPSHLGKTVHEWNEINSVLLDILRSLDFEVIEVPEEIAIADPTHRWGRSPFHYIPEVYDYCAREIVNRHRPNQP